MFMFAMCMIYKICSVYDLDVQAYCLYPKIYNYNYNYYYAALNSIHRIVAIRRIGVGEPSMIKFG